MIIASIQLGEGAGNTMCDAGSEQISVVVYSTNELVAIDPVQGKSLSRYKLPGIESPHGIAIERTASASANLDPDTAPLRHIGENIGEEQLKRNSYS